jgi:hypothetical protein
MLIDILLLEDNPGDARLIQEALKAAGANRLSWIGRTDSVRGWRS